MAPQKNGGGGKREALLYLFFLTHRFILFGKFEWTRPVLLCSVPPKLLPDSGAQETGRLFRDKHGPVGGEIGGHTGNQIQCIVKVENLQFEFTREKIATSGQTIYMVLLKCFKVG